MGGWSAFYQPIVRVDLAGMTYEPETALPPASFAPTRRSITEARRAVADFVAGRVEPEVADAAALLSTELAANAVLHAGTEFVVSAGLEDGVLTVAVEAGEREPPILDETAPDAIGGRGVFLVDSYASRWGVEQHSDGKRVWFELDAEAVPADATSADATSADATSADATPADATSADATSADATPADATSADATSADATSADVTSADATSADNR
jgi:anti-sigma regulatory factor (Ser/Thr protein kinase)